MCSVAPGDVGGLADLLFPIRSLQIGDHSSRGIFEFQELRLAFNLDTTLAEALNQKPLVLVLGKDERIGKWAEPHAHFAQDGMCGSLAGSPEIRGDGLPPALHHRIRDANLIVELERPCLNSQ